MWSVKPSCGDIACMGVHVALVGAYVGFDWRPAVAMAIYAVALGAVKAWFGHVKA